MKKQFVLRHWRGNGQVIPDVKRKKYFDYPKYRNKPPYYLNECFVRDISVEEYKAKVLSLWGQEALNRVIEKYNLK